MVFFALILVFVIIEVLIATTLQVWARCRIRLRHSFTIHSSRSKCRRLTGEAHHFGGVSRLTDILAHAISLRRIGAVVLAKIYVASTDRTLRSIAVHVVFAIVLVLRNGMARVRDGWTLSCLLPSGKQGLQ